MSIYSFYSGVCELVAARIGIIHFFFSNLSIPDLHHDILRTKDNQFIKTRTPNVTSYVFKSFGTFRPPSIYSDEIPQIQRFRVCASR